MRFSFVIPAYNAAATLAAALDSLLRQTNPDWEAIVVDDGSTDATRTMAEGYARRDSRIRVIRQGNAGMSAARNAGLREARGEWVIFLDADDWMHPQALVRFSRTATDDPAAQAIYGHWVRVTPGGEVVDEVFWPTPEGLFPVVARFCPFAIHSCAVRRRLLEHLHGFDPEFRYCADWDLWQRIARGGTRIAITDTTVAFYRMSLGSSMVNVDGIAAEGMEIIARGHRSDPRVLDPDPRYAEGARNGMASAMLGFLSWQAGIVLSLGGDARPLLRFLGPDVHDPELRPVRIAHALYGAAPLPRGAPPRIWPDLWDDVAPQLVPFLDVLETRARAQGLARRTRSVLERLVLQQTTRRPVTIGGRHCIRLEVTQPLVDIDTPPGVERLQCMLTLQGEPLGELELPAIGPTIPPALLADAIVADYAWPILNRFFSRTVYPSLEREIRDDGASIRRGGTLLGECLPVSDPGDVALHEAIGWTVFLQELWGLPEWPLERFFVDPEEAGAERFPATAGEPLTIELCDRLPLVAASLPVDVEWTLAGVPVYFASVEPVDGAIGSRLLRSTVINAVGLELARVAVRECLIGRPLTGPESLRERLRAVASVNRFDSSQDSSTPQPGSVAGTRLSPSWRRAMGRMGVKADSLSLFRHAEGVPGTSASRRALLPSANAAALIDLARQEGEPWVGAAREEDAVPVSYVPEALWIAPAAAGRQPPPQQRVPDLGTAALSLQRSRQLPILLYHRVSDGPPGPLARYRVSPENFETQIRYLRDQGFRSVTLDEWAGRMRRSEPLDGRGVLITFDDGYRDFAESAWPVLKRYGFGALVFLVSDRVGESTEWTAGYGETAPLLDWAEIRRLQDEGVQFGSHSATHPHFEALSPAEVVREAVRSRMVLQRELGVSVTSLAYPNGSEDKVIHHLVGACGYIYGLSCRAGLSGFNDPLLALPRVEIFAKETLADFIRKLEQHPPNAAGG